MLRSARFLFAALLVAAITCAANVASADSPRVYSLFPQFVVGSGWSCEIFVNNQDSHPAQQVVVSLYKSTGQALVANSNLGTSSSFTFNLAVGATQLIRLSSAAGAQIGYAVLSAPPGSSVRASLVFYFRNGALITNQLGVLQVFPSTSFSFPAEVNLANGISTGIALCNPVATGGGNPLEIVISLITENGTLQDFETINLSPGGHSPRFLQEIFPGLATFRGSVNVSAAQPFGVIALRTEQGSLGSLAINPSPVLGPFQQNGWQYAELEPNDTLTANQQINLPAAIDGTFSSGSDLDLFVINAKRGDVLSAMTQTNGNGADPVLSLLSAGGTELATNDQNGLLGQEDAFIQAVLPSDGKYYLRVQQSNQQPAGAFTYRLYARLLGVSSQAGPLLSSLAPASMARGNTIYLAISGSTLCGATGIGFVPPAGITATDIFSSASMVTARITIDPAASPGTRLLYVIYGNSSSNALPVQILASGASAPQVSSLTAGAPYTYQGYTLIDIRFNFFDNDADIVYLSGDAAHSARAMFTKPGAGLGCVLELCNSVLNAPGKQSGSFTFTMRADSWVNSTSTINFELIDAAGNISNLLTFQPSLWKCGP